MKYSDLDGVHKENGVIYLDSAATTLMPRKVLTEMSTFTAQSYATVHRGLYPLAIAATQQFEESRKKVAQFIGAKPSEIIFTSGATDSLNAIAQMLKKHFAKQGIQKPKILLPISEHHANIVPWQSYGFELTFIPIIRNAKQAYLFDTQFLKNELQLNQYQVVSFAHVSNVTGAVADVASICKLANKHNVLSVIDGAQSVAYHKIDVAKLNCDFFCFSAHKMYGPTGVGILYMRDEFHKILEPFRYGGNMIEAVSLKTSTFAQGPQKFEAGTLPIQQVVGLSSAISYLEKRHVYFDKKYHSSEGLQMYFSELHTYARTLLTTECQKCNIPITITTAKNAQSVLSFALQTVHAHDLADLLGEKQICVRGGHHCCMPLHTELGLSATVRISFSVYTQKSDITLFVKELIAIAKLFG